MSADSKLGMVLGVVVVLTVAVIYFPKSSPSDRTTAIVPSLPAMSRGVDTVQLPR